MFALHDFLKSRLLKADSSTVWPPPRHLLRAFPLFFVCTTSLSVAVADDNIGATTTTQNLPASDTPVLVTSGVLTFPQKTDTSPPVFVRSDEISGVENAWLDAQGHVEFRRGAAVVTADHLHYTLATDRVDASGNVNIDQQGLSLHGPSLGMFMKKQLGAMQSPSYTYLNPGPLDPSGKGVKEARGDAASVEFKGPNHYQLNQTTYTTCRVGDNDWALHMKDLNLDTQNQVGTAHGVVLDFLQKPIFYTPWINFPLDDARKSGFLAPEFGTTSTSGATFSLPWYWNIAPNYDATITPTIYSKRGLEAGGEFRYLTDNSQGTIDGNYLNDKLTGTARWDIFAQLDQTFTPNLTGHLVYQSVSDSNFFTDLSNNLYMTSMVTLDQEASLTWHGSWWQLTGGVQQFQTLQDPAAPIIPPYARMPELTFSGDKILNNGLDFNMYSDVTTFVHPTLVNGTREVFYPSLSLPMSNSYGYVTPKIGLNYTAYQLGLNNTDPQSQYTRTLPIMSLDTGMYFDRNTTFMGTQYQQTLEPRLYYLYIPYQNQNQLPIFDTAALDPINYATLFTENRFVGYDRINNANQITMALSSRFIDQATGEEKLHFAIGERLYFTPQLVNLPIVNALGQVISNNVVTNNAFSDILGDVGGQITADWRAEAIISYNSQTGQTDDESLVLSYQPTQGSVMNLSYRTLVGQIDEIDLSSEWPITRRLYGLFRYDYSILDKQVVQGLAGIEYNRGCWALRTMFQTIATAANTTSTAFFIQLQLNGLGNLGSNPLEALQLSIPGYISSNEITPPLR